MGGQNWYDCDSHGLVMVLLPALLVSLVPRAAALAPTVASSSVSTDEDRAVAHTVSATDPEGNSWTAVTGASPGHGSVSLAGGRTFTYTPEADWNGTDSFTWRARDSTGLYSDYATVTVTVGPVNDPPVATPQEAEVRPGRATALTLGGTDIDGDALTCAVGTVAPAHGSYVLSGCTATYTSDAAYEGDDAFTFAVQDGTDTSGEATVSLHVVDGEEAPVAATLSASGSEDASVAILLSASDPDGTTSFEYALHTGAANGSVSISGDVATYTPGADFAGTDTFWYTATDSTGLTSAPALVTVTVNGVNDAPVPEAASASTNEDTAVTFTLTATDVEGSSLTYSVASSPASGSVSLTGARARYTPAADWSGTDSFVFSVSDGVASATATATVTVAAVNDAPTVAAVSGSTAEDTAVTLVLSGSDADGAADVAGLVYVLASSPADGTATITGASLRYVPDAEWSGTDRFSYRATDPSGAASGTATVSVRVDRVDDPPVPSVLALTLDEGESGTVALDASDVDTAAEDLTYALTSSPASGTVTLSGRTARYRPDTGFDGADSFGWSVSDGTTTVAATVSVTVVNTNDPPTVSDGAAATDEDVPVAVLLVAVDPDGDPLTYVLTAAPAHGAVTISGATATYTPDADWNGNDDFQWRADDGTYRSDTATVDLVVDPVNDLPRATDTTRTLDEDGSDSSRLSAPDDDGPDEVAFAIVSSPAHGEASLVGNELTYTPNEDWNGTDTVGWRASDGAGSVTATLTFVVASVDDAPSAWPAVLHTSPDTPVQLTAPVTDPDSATLTLTLVSAPSHGDLSVVDGGFLYVPDDGWFGADHFTWRVSDGVLTSSVADTRVNVHPPTLFERAPMPQIGLNKVVYQPSGTAGAEPYWPENIAGDFAALGIDMQRQLSNCDLTWSALEVSPGVFPDPAENLCLGDPLVEPSATLFENQYASPNPPWCGSAADFEADMNEDAYLYLAEVVADYSGLVTSFELGNEMFHWDAATPPVADDADLPVCSPADGYSPEAQAGFLQEAGEFLRWADPAAVITLASINTESAPSAAWFDGVITTASDADWFDIISYHNYDPWSRMYNTRDDLEATIQELGLTDKLVRLTEFGSTSDPDNTAKTNYPNSDETQCADIFRLPLIAWGRGDVTAIWHTYLPTSEADDSDFGGFSIVQWDGTWKPSAYTFQLLAEELLPFSQIEEYSSDSRYVFRLRRVDGEERWVMWGERPKEIPAGMTEYTSVYPNADGSFTWLPLPAAGALALEDTPYLLR